MQPAPGGLAVTLSVHNDGTKEGTTRCRVFDPQSPGIGDRPAVLESPRVAAGSSASFTEVVTVFGPDVRALDVECTDCGAIPGAVCVDEGGTRSVPHMARVERYADHRHRMSRP